MGRGRGKWKRPVTVAANENPLSGGEEKIMPLKRRGRPLKLLKKETEEKEETNTTEGEVVIENEVKYQVAEEDGRKRKSSPEIDEGLDFVDEENGVKTRAVIEDSVKFVGFRQSGSRRKNKPRRAADVGVECYCY